MTVCEHAYGHTSANMMMNAIQVANSGSTRWVLKYRHTSITPIAHPSLQMQIYALPYALAVPLSIYMKVAVIDYGSDPLGQQPLEDPVPTHEPDRVPLRHRGLALRQ